MWFEDLYRFLKKKKIKIDVEAKSYSVSEH